MIPLGTMERTLPGVRKTLTALAAAVVVGFAARADVYLVESNENPVAPYDSWATAATNLYEALTALGENGTLHVGDGTYALTNQFALASGKAIVSKNGPDKAVFVGQRMNVWYTIDIQGGATLTGVTLKNLTANEHYFGGVTLSNGTVSNCVFLAAYTINGVNNTHPAALKQTGGRVVDCTFRNSYAKAKNGTVANISAGTMERCRVFGTTGSSDSTPNGALYVSGTGLVSHTLVTDSSHCGCTGIYVTDSGVVSNCTVTANETLTRNGNAGIYVAKTTARVYNTICVGNYDHYGTTRPIAGVSGYESCLTDCFTDETTDPRFSAPLAEDFTLLPDSPCKGKGAYDYTLPTGNGAAIFREMIGGWRYDPQTNVFTAVVTPDGATCDEKTCYWTFDGSVPSADNHAATGLVATNVFGMCLATVRFRATVNGTAVAVDRTNWFAVTNGYVYVVKDNPNAAAPYDTWATAAASYNTGFAALGEHMTLVISNGTYQGIVSALSPPRFSTVRSANGAGTVTFTRYDGNLTCVFDLTKYGSRVEGLTFYYCSGTSCGPLKMSAAATVADCVYTNMTTGNNWGTLFEPSAGLVVGCKFAKNSGADRQDGKAVVIDATGSAVIDRCIFDGNTRTASGTKVFAGVVRVSGGATVRNSLFINNYFPVYSGIYVGANGHAENCTVVKNQTRVNKSDNAAASAIYAAAETADIVNCLAVGNVDLSGSASANTAYAEGCSACFTTCREADSVSDPDIRFTDPTADDYTLQPKSVCVDAGTARDWMDGARDLSGNPRVARTAPDIGAYENTPSTALGATLSHTAVDGRSFAPQLTEFSAEITPEGATCDPTTCYWTFDGREPTAEDHDAVGLVVTNTVGIGDVSIAFRATVNGEAVSVDLPNWYHATGEIVYVNQDSANPVSPYDTWETAAKTYADGYTALREGMTMLITNGSYKASSTTRTPPKNTVIRSVNGPEKTKFTLMASNWGLVFILSNPSCTISGFTLASTHTDGGPISMSASYCVVTNCIINVGKTGGNPRKTIVQATAGTIVDCVFTNSYSCETSGDSKDLGICVSASGAGTLVDRCVFADNSGGSASATTWAQGIVRVSGGATVRNSLFKDNTVPFCTIYLAANGHAENCTLVRNTARRAVSADATVGAIYVADATASVSNCLVVANLDSALASANTAYAEGCEGCFTTCKASDSLLDTEIKFTDPAAADYTLQAKSVCVNAGTNADWMDGALDLVWNPRIAKGVVDIGCYEYTPSTAIGATLSHQAVDGRQFAPQLTEFSAEITPEDAEFDPEECYWTFDGEEPTAAHHDAVGVCVTNLIPVGNVTVKFRATVNGQAVAVDQTDWYRAKGEFVYVSAKSANPSSPYDTWETAATTFMDGFGVLEESMTMVVSNGNYVGRDGAPVEPPMHTTVRSVNGPAVTTFSLVRGDRGQVFNLSQTGCTLAGFGFNSTHTDGGPIVMSGSHCVVSNCVINNKQGEAVHVWGRLIVATAGTVVDCVITNNRSGISISDNQALSVEASGTGTLIDRCVFAGNAGGTGGTGQSIVRVSGGATIRNSLFKNNTAPASAIAVGANGHVENCTVVTNRATLAKASDATVGAIYAAAATADIVNCLAASNIDSENASANAAAASGAEDCFTTCHTEGDPRFKNAAAGDYRLKMSSPCVNAGTLCDWMADAKDLNGAPRVQRAPDVGCYERDRRGLAIICK